MALRARDNRKTALGEDEGARSVARDGLTIPGAWLVNITLFFVLWIVVDTLIGAVLIRTNGS